MKPLRPASVLAHALAAVAGLAAGLAAPAHAQGAGPPGAFVTISLGGCQGTTVLGAGAVSGSCTPLPLGTSSAAAENTSGLLRAATSVTAAEGVNVFGQGRAAWRDQLTFQGGLVPASAVFRFELRGTLALEIGQGGGAAANEALLDAFLLPEGWGGPGSSNGGRLSVRQESQQPGAELSRFFVSELLLPVSTVGVRPGLGFRVDTAILVGSNASVGRGQTATGRADFQDTAGLASLRFFDDAGADITGQTQWGFVHGTAFLPAIPEPGTAALWLAGLAGVVVATRRRRADRCAVPLRPTAARTPAASAPAGPRA